MSQVLSERAIGILTAGMSTRAVAREFNVNFSSASDVILENLEVHPTNLTTTDHVYGIVWVSGLLMSTL
jgi:hypothetical protein